LAGLLLIVAWLAVVAALVYWLGTRVKLPPTHRAVFAGSVIAAFIVGWVFRGGSGPAAPVPTPVAQPSVNPAMFVDSLSAVEFPSTVPARHDQAGSIIVENRSVVTWPTHAERPVLLGFFVYDSSGHAVRLGRAALGADFAPHQKRRIGFTIPTPDSPGLYTLKLDLVYESIGWFQKPITIPIKVI
jgi:hypothetical protein